MEEIPQRVLRNDISAVLRAAEAGAHYTVTVGGRPVAELTPYRGRTWVTSARVAELLASGPDREWLEDIDAEPVGDRDYEDVWGARHDVDEDVDHETHGR